MTGDTGWFTTSESRFGGSPVRRCAGVLVLRADSNRASDIPVAQNTADKLVPSIELSRAMRRGRRVRPPRDLRTDRDDPECLPPTGALRRTLLTLREEHESSPGNLRSGFHRSKTSGWRSHAILGLPRDRASFPRRGSNSRSPFRVALTECERLAFGLRLARPPFTRVDAPFWRPARELI